MKKYRTTYRYIYLFIYFISVKTVNKTTFYIQKAPLGIEPEPTKKFGSGQLWLRNTDNICICLSEQYDHRAT